MTEQDENRRDAGFWELALDRAQLGVWDWDLRSNDCFYSPTWARMLGYEPQDLPRTSDLWLRLSHPDDRQRAIDSGDRHLAGLTDFIETELRLKHRDGRWIWVLDRGGVIERDAEGRPVRMVGVQTDITRQKAAERELEQVNVRFRLALEASGTGIWSYDIDRRRSYWDVRSREIFGLVQDQDEVSNELWHTFLHPEDREATEKAHRLPAGSTQVVRSRYRIVRRDGATRHVESLIRYVPEPDTSGRLLGTVRDVTDEHRRERELAHAARHDPLTGLLNRAAFDEALAGLRDDREALPLAVFYIDLDYFKALNDFAGHAAGDVALRRISAGIRSVIPDGACVARLGGDEFALVVPNCDVAPAEELARRILETIRDADLGPSSGSRRLAASIGIAFVADSAVTVSDALASADDACYAAKATGRNRYALFSAEGSASTVGLNAARMASDTMDALESDRVALFGQEIHRLADGDAPARHIEVLVRLISKDGRLIAPGEFIPAAERFGVASKLDRWIFRTTLERFGAAATRDGLTLAFNLSAQTLSDPLLWEFVDSVIDRTVTSPSNIMFEITETAAVTNFEAAEAFILNARQRQCRVSLDDFGAGMSSFDYLRRFPIDAIKINGSFVEHMTESRYDREIVSAITGIARSLGYEIVAEKIERQDTLDMLRDMGVDFGQGFLLHRPQPLAEIIAVSAVKKG